MGTRSKANDLAAEYGLEEAVAGATLSIMSLVELTRGEV